MSHISPLRAKYGLFFVILNSVVVFFCYATVTAVLYAASCHIRLRYNDIKLYFFTWEYTLRTDVKLTHLATPFGKFFLTLNTFINMYCVDKALILENKVQMLPHDFHLLLCPFIS